jgi:gluconate 2-dehydrogenase gamma chain
MIHPQQSPSRREFIKSGLLAFSGVLMLPSCLKNYTPFLFLTADEALTLSSICEQIIPADENGPGATQAGVIYYIDKQLHDIFISDQAAYREGLRAIGDSCNELHSVPYFEHLGWDQQKGFLRMMEKNELPAHHWQSLSASAFFNIIIWHTMQGFYGSPRHGGNKDYISYRMIGLEYPYVVGRNLYREQSIHTGNQI